MFHPLTTIHVLSRLCALVVISIIVTGCHRSGALDGVADVVLRPAQRQPASYRSNNRAPSGASTTDSESFGLAWFRQPESGAGTAASFAGGHVDGRVTSLTLTDSPRGTSDETDTPPQRPWHVEFAFRMGFIRLEETSDELNARLERPLKLDALGLFHNPATPLDRKTDANLNTFLAGFGRRQTDWLTWKAYFGTGFGSDRNHQRVLNANLKVNFHYAVYYAGLAGEIYPWGHPADVSGTAGAMEHLRASRPFLLAGIETAFVRAEGFGRFSLAPVPIYHDEQTIRDWLFSFLIGLGWEVPVSDRWSFNLSGHYAFHLYRPAEYNGWNVTYAVRYRF